MKSTLDKGDREGVRHHKTREIRVQTNGSKTERTRLYISAETRSFYAGKRGIQAHRIKECVERVTMDMWKKRGKWGAREFEAARGRDRNPQ